MYIVQCTMYIVRHTLYVLYTPVQYTSYSVRCTSRTVSRTVRDVHYIPVMHTHIVRRMYDNIRRTICVVHSMTYRVIYTWIYYIYIWY